MIRRCTLADGDKQEDEEEEEEEEEDQQKYDDEKRSRRGPARTFGWAGCSP